MALPTFVKKDEIPKGFEDLYEEKDGKWAPKEVDDAGEVKKALAKERDAREKLEKQRAKTQEERDDFERKLTAAQSGDEKDKVRKALEKFDADKVALEAKFKADMDKANAELRGLKLTDKVKAAFLAAGGRAERADKILRDTDGRLDLDGDRIVVKNAKGEVTTETVEDFFKKTYKAEVPEFYQGTKAMGSGGGGGAGNRPITGTGKMTPDEIVENPLRAMQMANAEGSEK